MNDNIETQQPMGMTPEGAETGFPPEGMGAGVPPVGMGEEMATPEQQQELMDMVEKIKDKVAEAKRVERAGKDNLNNIKSELVKRVFEIMQLSGVDLSKRESVSDFLVRLAEKDPRLAEWFEKSMDLLLGPDGDEAMDTEETPEEMLSEEGMPTLEGPSDLSSLGQGQQYENTNEIGEEDIPPQNL
jgi:hypothetical protein